MLLFVIVAFPPQMVQIFSESTVVPIVGSNHTVQCIARRRDTLSLSTLLEIIWLDNNNLFITSTSNTVITGVASSTDTNITSTLKFSRLRTSQAGNYACVVNMTIPDVVEDHQVMKTTDVYVRSKFLIGLLISWVSIHYITVCNPLHEHSAISEVTRRSVEHWTHALMVLG